MLSFLKYSFATVVGICLFFLFFFGIAFLFVPSGKPSTKDNSVLELKLSEAILEQSAENPLEDLDLPISTGEKSGVGLIEIKKAIRHAIKDNKIKGIVLRMSGVNAGFATMQEVREVLLEFKEKSKKFIYAYSDSYSEGAYYLASVADKIYLNPQGDLEMNGLVTQPTFFKGTLEKLEIKPEIFKVGTFKSAVEPFLLDKMSDASREQTTSFLNSIYNFYLTNVGKSRNIAVEKLKMISDSMLVREPKDALTHGLVTHVAYFDEFDDMIRKELKVEEKEKINKVTLRKYIEIAESGEYKSSSNKIAIIVGQGEISTGMNEGGIGSDMIVAELRKARKDKEVKAIVLRINSPGGSALASDIMWREIQITKKVKPVIASMGDYAASGGYYMAMGCDAIVAQPNTLTGSIGVFGMMFYTGEMFKNKLGMTFDEVATGKFSGLGNPNKLMTKEERDIIQKSVEKIYEEFTTKAAEGRKMNVEDLKKIASGRVWTGEQGKANGLVDKLGNFEDAIALAAEKAKLKKDDYKLKYYPTKKDFFSKISEKLGGAKISQQVLDKYLEEKMGDVYKYYQFVEKIGKMDKVQARIPFTLEFK